MTERNTFRLNRLSNTSEFRKHSISQYNTNPKDTFKLAALNSITRGVKYNDLSFITGRQLPKLRKQPEQADNLEYGAAHQNLTAIRKKHDNAAKQKLQKQSKVALLKEQRDKYKVVQDEYLQGKSIGQQRVKALQDELNQIKLSYQQSDWNKKVYQNISSVYKNDKVVYDQRKYDMEKQLQHLKKQLNIFKLQGTGVNEETDRTVKVYNKLLKQLQAEQFQRDQHIQNLQSMIDEKRNVNQNNEVRKLQIQQIASKAMQDKDQNEKNWMNILNVHKLVDNLLRTKMFKQMEKFSTVQTAFKNIKIATGVSDAQTLIFKFLNKEEVYGQLLSKIADNQKRITFLKAQKDQLWRQRKKLKQEKTLYQTSKHQSNDFRAELKNLDDITQKLKHANLDKDVIRNWLSKNFKKVNNIQKTQQDSSIKRQNQHIVSSFKKYLTILSDEIQKCSNDQEQTNSSQIGSFVADNKLFRVKPKVKKLNQSGQEIENEHDQEELPNTNQQEDVIATQRTEILKQNQKFMKELKRKMQEIKKARLDAQPKKKQTKAPQKPVQVDQN